MRFGLVCFAFSAAALLVCAGSFAAEETAPANTEISYFKQILPIFRAKNCTGFHQPAKQLGRAS
jgi:hypothetical protein